MNFLASLCSLGDWFETRFVGNPEDRFSRDAAHLYSRYGLCRPVAELDVCEAGEKAEDILVQPNDFDGQTYTRVGWFLFVCLFDSLRLINNHSVKQGRIFLG